MTGNLLFGSYIILKLLMPLKIKGSFIIAFYVVSFLMTILRILEVSFCIHNPDTQDWEYGYKGVTFFRIVAITATLSSFALGLVIISTMYQLALSIRVMVGDVDYL